MPTTKGKKTSPKPKKTEKSIENEPLTELDINPSLEKNSETQKSSLKNLLYSKKIYVILLIIAILVLLYYKKDLIIAASVNNAPITNFEVMDKMNKQFREQTINQIINERIILGEARKNNIVVRKADIDQKLTELEQNVGGAEVLDSLLAQQGQTRDSIKDQLKVQLTIEKLYEKDATVSAEEVQAFIEQNKAQLRATESAAQQKEATDILKQQKLSQIFNEKFQQLKQNAKITIF